MITTHAPPLEPTTQSTVDELAALIRASHPTAQFQVLPSPDGPSTMLLEAIVNLDDPDEALDLVFERMQQLRIDEGVPILVLPLQTPERAVALLEARHTGGRATIPAALS